MAVQDELGGADDAVQIKIGDEDIRSIVESYEVKISILQVPSAFSLRLGWSDLAVDLLNKAKPGTPFELWIGRRKLQSGAIDARAVPSAANTTVEIRGRDHLARLFDAFVAEDQEFPEKTYFDLTRKVMDVAGLTEANGFKLSATNDVARQLLTGTRLTARQDSVLATEVETGALGGTGSLVYQTPKAKVGERYYDFLQRQYKLAGLFLWATPDKTFVLAAPNSRQPPSYRVYRARGGSAAADEVSNVLDCRYNDDTTMRHSIAEVFGRSGGGKKGTETCFGEFLDDEIFNYGINKSIVIHDADVKNREQCEFVARRIISEERRAGWQLEYTVAGHTTFSPDADNQTATWGPDTVVQVEDHELGIPAGPYYLEACTYSRSSNGTTTKLTLMRTTDLLFATGLDSESGLILQRKLKVPRGKTVR